MQLQGVLLPDFWKFTNLYTICSFENAKNDTICK